MTLRLHQPTMFAKLVLLLLHCVLLMAHANAGADPGDEVTGAPYEYRPPPMSFFDGNTRNSSDYDLEDEFRRPPPGFMSDEEWDEMNEANSVLTNEKSMNDFEIKVGHPSSRQSVTVVPCGTRRLTAGYYYMQSPDYPKDYPNSHYCSYRLYPPTGGSISSTCNRNSFSLESSSRCANDYLQFFSTKYCGTTAPHTRTDYSYMRATFCTNSAVTSSGFRCLIEVKSPGAGPGLRCGFHRLRPGTYTFSSINHPQNYENYRFCRWYFFGYNRSDRVTISCSRFSLESHSSCQYDYLNVNGRRYCGTTRPTNASRNWYAYAIFSTDFSVTSTGFQCTVQVTAAGCRCGIKNRRVRVVGGQDANSGEYPWMAGLVSPGGTRTFCGGSLINDRYVLTAAHCTARRTPSTLQILLGDHRIGVSDGESRHSVSRITPHPSYVNYRTGWDFSLVRLTAPVTFTSRRSPICLPTAGRTYAGCTAIATGFGRTGATQPQATILQEVSLPVRSEAQCRVRWSFINNSHICAGGIPAGGESVCYGDSGGPLITQENGHYVLIGVVSFGRPCAVPNYPDVYGRVTAALGWIRTTTADATYCT